MSGTSASRTGRARVLVVDDKPTLTAALRTTRGCAPHAVVLPALMLTAKPTPADDSVRLLGDLALPREPRQVHRAVRPIRLTAGELDLPMIHTVRGAVHTITPTEYGR
ncbi:hypothetical protein [Streptomyces longisporus]|uniref:Response regulator n=1 Tax=Streptomyces longisporus TaxID=1948 RepID=A0ABN3M6X0_STRLO